MENPKKFISVALIGIACFTGFFLYYFGLLPGIPPPGGNNHPNGDSSGPLISVDHINITVDYKNGTIDVWNNFTLDNYKTTPFDAVDKWCYLSYDEYPSGDYYVTVINGRGVGWIYKVNGVKPNYACNFYYLKSGDVIEWEFQ